MLLASLTNGLSLPTVREQHGHWYRLLTGSLCHWGDALASVVKPILANLCCNVQSIAQLYATDSSNMIWQAALPPDYCSLTLDCLQRICFFCLSVAEQRSALAKYEASSTQAAESSFSVFSSLFSGTNSSSHDSNNEHGSAAVAHGADSAFHFLINIASAEVLEAARSAVINALPMLLDSVANLWHAVLLVDTSSAVDRQPRKAWIMAHPEVVRTDVLALLNPLCADYSEDLLLSLALVWYERRARPPQGGVEQSPLAVKGGAAIPGWTVSQMCLLDMCRALEKIPLDRMLCTIREIIRTGRVLVTAKVANKSDKNKVIYCCLTVFVNLNVKYFNE